ncbi:MAG: hypothetical protein H7Y86_00910 [Rhizobacter sp.]|nr:hypothetical protein [Ferruginibacter sp.]
MLTRQHKFVLILCAFVFSAIKINAQDHASNKLYAIVQQGFVFNNSDVGVQPGLAAGGQWKGFGLGIAAAIDFLSVRSFQTSIDLRKTANAGKFCLVAFVNPGLNNIIPTKKEKQAALRFYQDQQFKNGTYLEAGGGILMGKKKNLLAAFYWSRKTYKETYTNILWNPVLQNIEAVPATNKYITNRLGIKLAIIF